MRLRRHFWACLTLAVLPGAAASDVAQIAAPVTVEGRRELVYELPLADDPPARVEVTGAGNRILARFEGAALTQRIAADRKAIYLEVTVPAGTRVLRHRLRWPDGRSMQRDLAVSPKPPVVLGPPLGAGHWVAVHAPEWPRGHRRVYYGDRLPGRYAIDFVGIDEDGRTSTRDPDRPAAAIGYGAPVLAVADATVAAARDGTAESASIAANAKHPGDAAAGNYVALALGDGRYAFYEHLAPGSITVRPGQRVRRGQSIGRLGFTGDSTGPHLHFHVADHPTPLGGDGLPFAFDRFRLLGRYDDLSKLGGARWTARTGDEPRRSEWPGYNVVIRFD